MFKEYKVQKLPEVEAPSRYSQETTAQYNERRYRWRLWLSQEPRPAFWYATEQEIQQYRQWRDTANNKESK